MLRFMAPPAVAGLPEGLLVQRHTSEGVAGRRFLRRAGGRRLHCRSWCAHAEWLDSRVMVGRSVGAALRSRASDDGHVARSSMCAEDSGRRGASGAEGVASAWAVDGAAARLRALPCRAPAVGRCGRLLVQRWEQPGRRTPPLPLGAWPRQRCPGHGSPPKFALTACKRRPGDREIRRAWAVNASG